MNIGKYIPWAALGQIIGIVIVIPLGYYLLNKLYYPYKYNEEAEQYHVLYMRNSYGIDVKMPDGNSMLYLRNQDEDVNVVERFQTKGNQDYFNRPRGEYVPFYSPKYKKYFCIMYFNYYITYDFFEKEVMLTVNKDDMTNPEYGTRDNPVPVLKMVGVHESIRDNNKDYDKAYMDSFYRKNVIMYLKYKMPKEEFERRFKNKE